MSPKESPALSGEEVKIRSEWLDRAIERVVSSRPEQGLPLKVEDPLILRRVATVLRSANADTERSRVNGHKNGHADGSNGHA